MNYKILYLKLFGSISKATGELMKNNSESALQILCDSISESEKLFNQIKDNENKKTRPK